ncbi:auxin-induced in root cultures protein 12 [Vigna unguiculata]|uniref:auxin-induced in root cultures protein 12 n=1 Tax=Vigna unguiculata TaxID=3917 RepID=UPI001016A736|nr:auxin-induced in root cultures protein 12 [Vigna unguiculata]
MAFHTPFKTTIALSLLVFLSLFFTSSHSALTCTSYKIPKNRTYANCTALPTLGAILHYTYNATNRTLAVAYAAEPPKPSGWVAWGLNLAGGGMIGTEAFIAIPGSSGGTTVHRYNLTSYRGIDEVKAFTFDSWDVATEADGGVVAIFAVVAIPEKAGNVTHVWQVGPTKDGKLSIHEAKPDNLQAKAALPVALAPAAAGGSGNSSGSGNATAPAAAGGDKSGVSERFGAGFYFGLVVALMTGVVAL